MRYLRLLSLLWYLFIPVTVFGYYPVPTQFIAGKEMLWEPTINYIQNSTLPVVDLTWNGGGGNMQVMLEVVDAILATQQTGKQVILHVSQVAGSAHATAACYADKIILNEGALLYFHAGRDEKTHEIEQGDKAKAIKEIMKPCFDKKLLTDEDYEEMQQGYAFFITKLQGKIVKGRVNEETGKYEIRPAN